MALTFARGVDVGDVHFAHRSFECLDRIHDTGRSEGEAGRVDDGWRRRPRAEAGNQPLPSACAGVSAAGDAKWIHPKGINGLLTITIY